MTDPEITGYLLQQADDIDYASLELPLLSKLATQLEDPFIATSALGQLARRDREAAARAAEQILDGSRGDRHLVAFALTVLFERDPASGIRWMTRLGPSCEDPTILEAMLENVLGDAERFAEHAELVRAIARRVTALTREQFSDPEMRDRFVARFGGTA
ncbi:MAG: hypothetical protein ABI867_07545 [Kofleriaceae bacterium]